MDDDPLVRSLLSSAPLSGVSDNGAPVVERFRVSDPDNGDYVYSDDDALTVVFDRLTCNL